MEQEKDRQTVLVPVRRCEAIPEKELPKEPPESGEAEAWKMPKRWHVY